MSLISYLSLIFRYLFGCDEVQEKKSFSKHDMKENKNKKEK
jgi:hypothetical protein